MFVQQLSVSTEMYLKALIELSGREPVAIGRLAERLSVTPVSANEMMRRLSEQGLVTHTPRRLTPQRLLIFSISTWPPCTGRWPCSKKWGWWSNAILPAITNASITRRRQA